MKARCWFEEEPRVDFIRNIAPWDADDLDADRSRGLRLDSERPLIKVLLTAAFGRLQSFVDVRSHVIVSLMVNQSPAILTSPRDRDLLPTGQVIRRH